MLEEYEFVAVTSQLGETGVDTQPILHRFADAGDPFRNQYRRNAQCLFDTIVAEERDFPGAPEFCVCCR